MIQKIFWTALLIAASGFSVYAAVDAIGRFFYFTTRGDWWALEGSAISAGIASAGLVFVVALVLVFQPKG